jgi:hypothetical protein
MNQRTETEINDIVNSVDNINRAEVSPYFNTKLNGRLQIKSDNDYTGRYLFILAASLFLLLFNSFFINNQFKSIKIDEESKADETSYTYELNTTNYNYDIKEK